MNRLVQAINTSGVTLVVDIAGKRIGFQATETAAWEEMPEHARKETHILWITTDWRDDNGSSSTAV